MTATLDNAAADLQRDNAELRRQLDGCRAELAARNSEYGERIEHQSATIDVLKAMSASPGDPQPVFDLIVRRARELCNATDAALFEFDGELVHLRSMAWRRDIRHARRSGSLQAAVSDGADARFHHLPGDSRPADHSCARHGDRTRTSAPPFAISVYKSQISLPLLRDGAAIGAVALSSGEIGGFTDSQVALLQTFAEQAVIAITSAETYRELQQRTGDLQESLEYQTATSDVLKVISRSTFDLQPVLDTLAETAARLCDAGYGAIYRRDGEVYRIATAVAFSPETKEAARKFRAFMEQHPLVPNRGSITGRVALERQAVHVADTASDPEYMLSEATTLGNLRTQLGVPLLREGEPIGVIALARQRVEPFTERQIELVRTFADQAVIAIENARLIAETREALEQQTATAEVLQVINSSPGDLAAGVRDDARKGDAIVRRRVRRTYGPTTARSSARGGSRRAAGLCRVSRRDRRPIAVRAHGPARSLAGRARRPHRRLSRTTEAYRSGDPSRRALGRSRRRPHIASRRRCARTKALLGAIQRLSPGGPAVHRQADRAAAELRGAGGHRDGERAAARRIAAAHRRSPGIARIPDRDQRCAQGHQPLDLRSRPGTRVRHRDRDPAVPSAYGQHLPAWRTAFIAGRSATDLTRPIARSRNAPR